MNLDSYLFNKLNRFASKTKFDWATIFFARYLILFIVGALFITALLSKNIWLFLIPTFSGVFSRYAANEIFYLFYKRKRPSQVLSIRMIIKDPHHPSFPSGHASFLFGLSFACLYFSSLLGIIFIILSAIVCFFRVFAGVHWPSDILSGVVVGFFSSILAINFKKMDLYLFNLLHNLVGKYPVSDYLGIFFSKYAEYLLWVALALFLIIGFKKYWKMVALALVAGGVSRFIFTEIIRKIWFRPRPFLAKDFIPLIKQSASEGSFPSGHAAFYFAVSTIVYIYNKKAGIVFYVVSCLIVLGRVYVGVHWPSDIFFGAVLGIAVAWLVNKVATRFFPKLT